MRLCVLVAVSAILVACTSIRPVEGPVRLRQTAFVDGPKVRPHRVIEDSRCPLNTQCVWPGRLIVRATVSGGGWWREIDLTLGTSVMVADGLLTLVAAVPARRSGEQGGKLLPYRFTFGFQGGL